MNKNFFTALILCITIFCTAISCKNVFAEDITSVSENISQPQITVDGKVVDLGDLGFFKYTLSQKYETDSPESFDANPFWSEFYKQIFNMFGKMSGLEIIDWDAKKQMITLSTFMIPLREVAQKMGYKVEWNKENQKVTVSNDKREMFFYIGEGVYKAKYEEDNMRSENSYTGAAPLLFNDATFVPIEVLSSLGYSYEINDNCINFTK